MQPIIPIFLPQSFCPYKCIFCNQKLTVGGVDRLTSEDIKIQINDALTTISLDLKPQIGFYGGSFTLLPIEIQKEYLEAVQQFLREGLAKGIRISTRPDALDLNIVLLLKKYGVETVELGAQVLDDNLLNLIQRGHSLGDIEWAVSLLKENDFRVGLQLMIGLPGEDIEIRERSFDKVLKIKPDFIRIHPTIVLKGSTLEGLYISGNFKPLSLEESIDICALMVVSAESSGIEVIRLGLQSSVSLQEEGVVVAGPWHHSFGQLVKGEIYLRFILQGIKNLNKKPENVAIYSAKREISLVKGLNNKNTKTLNKIYPASAFSFSTMKDLGKYELVISAGDEDMKLTLKDLNFN